MGGILNAIKSYSQIIEDLIIAVLIGLELNIDLLPRSQAKHFKIITPAAYLAIVPKESTRNKIDR